MRLSLTSLRAWRLSSRAGELRSSSVLIPSRISDKVNSELRTGSDWFNGVLDSFPETRLRLSSPEEAAVCFRGRGWAGD